MATIEKKLARAHSKHYEKSMENLFRGGTKIKHSCMKHKVALDLPDGSTLIFCSLCNKRLGEFS